jgi:hypothetical protein
VCDVATFYENMQEAGGIDWFNIATETRSANGRKYRHMGGSYGLESEKFISPPTVNPVAFDQSAASNDTLKNLFDETCRQINLTNGTDDSKRHYVVAARLIIIKFLLVRDIAIESSKQDSLVPHGRFADIDGDMELQKCHLGKLVCLFFHSLRVVKI